MDHHFVGLKRQLDFLVAKLFTLAEEFLDAVEVFLPLFSEHVSNARQIVVCHFIDLLQ